MIKTILKILLISLPVLSFGQSSKNYFGTTKDLPLQNAKVYHIEDYGKHGCSIGDFLTFEPSNDSVFSFSSSVVCAVFDLGNGETIVTRDSSDRFYTYINLKEVSVKKGDRIKKGILLGLIVKNENRLAELIL
jgi:hypothetical protein